MGGEEPAEIAKGAVRIIESLGNFCDWVIDHDGGLGGFFLRGGLGVELFDLRTVAIFDNPAAELHGRESEIRWRW